MILCVMSCLCIRLYINLSMSLESVQRRLMGRYEVDCLWFSLDFEVRMIVASFQHLEKCASLNIVFAIYASSTTALRARFLRMMLSIPSDLGPLRVEGSWRKCISEGDVDV